MKDRVLQHESGNEDGSIGDIEGFIFDGKHRQFPQIVHWRGQSYDARDSSRGSSCIYRMTAEHRMNLEEPDYLEVDSRGRVLREWNG